MPELHKDIDPYRSYIGAIRLLRLEIEATAIFVFPDEPLEWGKLRRSMDNELAFVASADSDILASAVIHGFQKIHLQLSGEATIYDKMPHAVLEAVADDLIPQGSKVIALYSALEPGTLDSFSIISLNEHLDKLTGRDLRQLEDFAPLKTLKTIVDLAVEIGKEGREGHSVGTIFVVGDTRNVMAQSQPLGFDPVKGYHRTERSIFDVKVREGIKEIAQLDGAIIVAKDGVVEASCRRLNSNFGGTIPLSPGLGTRHWAAATITKTTKSIAIAVSASNGTIRVFRNGEVFLRIESKPTKPLVWRDFDSDNFENAAWYERKTLNKN
jgi:DNA integrity scanning protein DisA with diadenylate cyclase activity